MFRIKEECNFIFIIVWVRRQICAVDRFVWISGTAAFEWGEPIFNWQHDFPFEAHNFDCIVLLSIIVRCDWMW